MAKELKRVKVRNKTFRKNEDLLRRVVLSLLPKHRGRLRAKAIIKETKLSKQTIYKHYPELAKAPIFIEQSLLQDYNNWIKEQRPMLAKVIPDTNQRLFYILMLFMANNSKSFLPICKEVSNRHIIYKMIETIYPDLDTVWLPNNVPKSKLHDSKASVYISICVEVICQWGKTTGCKIDKSDEYIKWLQRISQEAYMRCR